jgi:hypothetical protein
MIGGAAVQNTTSLTPTLTPGRNRPILFESTYPHIEYGHIYFISYPSGFLSLLAIVYRFIYAQVH